jgi:nucleoside-diphosphate-sugar epimerase
MRVLVTGHLGYIGTVLVPMLLAEGHDVVGMDSDLYVGSNFGPAPLEVPNIRKDVRDATSDDLRGFDAVMHLAALSNDPLGNLDPQVTYEINHLAAANLGRVAKAAGVPRFLFSSSCSTYGAAGDAPIDESAEFNPVTPYGHSKVLAERDLAALADDSFTPVFLRNATAYGVSPRLRFDLVLNNLVAWAYTTGRIFMKSDGTPWRPIVHIADISRAFIALMDAPRDLVHNQAFNVGLTTENYRISELADIVKQVVPQCVVEYADDAGPDKRCYRVDCNRIAREIPGFKPQWTARRGAEELFAAYQAVGLQLDEFEGPRYKRIDHIKQLIAGGRLDGHLRWQEQTADILA